MQFADLKRTLAKQDNFIFLNTDRLRNAYCTAGFTIYTLVERFDSGVFWLIQEVE